VDLTDLPPERFGAASVVMADAFLDDPGMADSAMHRGHSPEPHLFVWMLTASSATQRTGVGRALLSTALGRARSLACRLSRHGQAGEPALLRLVRVRADRRDAATARGHALVHVSRMQ
jgi:GNAT superfamily N-acetyltransferase